MQSTLVEWGLLVKPSWNCTIAISTGYVYIVLVKQGYVYIVHGIIKHRGPSADLQVDASEI